MVSCFPAEALHLDNQFREEERRQMQAEQILQEERAAQKAAQQAAQRAAAQTVKLTAKASAGAIEAGTFPLENYKFSIVCEACLQPSQIPGHVVVITVSHQCAENVLVVAAKNVKNNSWIRIRERSGHRSFRGNYILCRNFPSRPCMVGVEKCSFAHSVEEQKFWALEKDGIFDLQEFISSKKKGTQGFAIKDLYLKHKGHLRFICRQCWYSGRPSRVCFQKNDVPQECVLGHNWNQVSMLAYRSPEGQILTLQPRPFTHKLAFFNMCHAKQYCQRVASANCNFAHSVLERDFWLLERDSGLSRDQIQQEYTRVSNQTTGASAPGASSTAAQPGSSSNSSKENSPAPTSTPAPTPAAATVRCPYQILEICSSCWKTGAQNEKAKDKDLCCNKSRPHQWSINRSYLVIPARKVLRPLPHTIPSKLKFVICIHVREKRQCTRETVCQFAHSETEMELWKWMVMNRGEFRALYHTVARATNIESG